MRKPKIGEYFIKDYRNGHIAIGEILTFIDEDLIMCKLLYDSELTYLHLYNIVNIWWNQPRCRFMIIKKEDIKLYINLREL